jgi:hypothetical protein
MCALLGLSNQIWSFVGLISNFIGVVVLIWQGVGVLRREDQASREIARAAVVAGMGFPTGISLGSTKLSRVLIIGGGVLVAIGTAMQVVGAWPYCSSS